MSAKKKFQTEIKKEDISNITQIRAIINNFLNSEDKAKKAAQVLNNWLQEKDKSQK